MRSQVTGFALHGVLIQMAIQTEDSNNGPLDPLTKTGTSFSGKLHGISGTFQCPTDCTLAATYSAENRLTELDLSDVADVRFKPGRLAATTASTAMVSLCDAPRSACAPTDADYMVFGYWRSEPADVQGTYQFEAFAFGLRFGYSFSRRCLATIPSEGDARYNGSGGRGVCRASAPFGSTDISKRQGEFEAAVSLTATLWRQRSYRLDRRLREPRQEAAAPRPERRIGVVTLADVNTTDTVRGGATIDGLSSQGNWVAQFVQRLVPVPASACAAIRRRRLRYTTEGILCTSSVHSSAQR